MRVRFRVVHPSKWLLELTKFSLLSKIRSTQFPRDRYLCAVRLSLTILTEKKTHQVFLCGIDQKVRWKSFYRFKATSHRRFSEVTMGMGLEMFHHARTFRYFALARMISKEATRQFQIKKAKHTSWNKRILVVIRDWILDVKKIPPIKNCLQITFHSILPKSSPL